MKQDLLWWICIAIGTAPAWGALFWTIWEGQIRPRFIPTHKIEAEADQLISSFGNQALEIAEIQEDRAWRYANSFEQTKWRRVGHTIKTRSAGKPNADVIRH